MLALFLAFLALPTLAASSFGTLFCLTQHCARESFSCLTDKQCRAAINCNRKCGTGPTSPGCNLLCQLTDGYESAPYKKLLQCMSSHKCLPVSSMPDGICKAKRDDGLKNLTDLDQIRGTWWILKGLNCGQKGWPSGFDYFPCQSDQFYQNRNGSWQDRIEYCGGTNSQCSTPLVHTYADISLAQPGVLLHEYKDAPLLPQNEDWIILSRPHPDWMLYVYCGSTPNGEYAGASVVSRVGRDILSIPSDVQDVFRNVSSSFGFSYDEMCITDTKSCPEQPIPELSRSYPN